MSVGVLMQALGVISKDYSSSGLHPALGFQPKHPGKSLASLPHSFPQPHRPLVVTQILMTIMTINTGHQARWGFRGNQLTLVELHLHLNHTPRYVVRWLEWVIGDTMQQARRWGCHTPPLQFEISASDPVPHSSQLAGCHQVVSKTAAQISGQKKWQKQQLRSLESTGRDRLRWWGSSCDKTTQKHTEQVFKWSDSTPKLA